jgi:hypothetical protein
LLTWADLRFPREVTTTQGLAALLAINGHSTTKRREALTFEVTGDKAGIRYQLGVPEARAGVLHQQLQTTIPGLAIKGMNVPRLRIDRVWQAWQTSNMRVLSTDQPEVISQAILTALAAVRGSETLVMQWTLGPVRRPTAVGSQVTGSHGPTFLAALAKAPFMPPADLDADARHALRNKQGLPGWRAILRIGVSAPGVARERQLLGGLSAAIRLAQGPSVELGFDGVRPGLLRERRLPGRWGLVINVGELLGLSGLPLGDTGHLPVPRVRSRPLPPSRALSSKGYVIGESSYPGQERPLAIPVADSLKHIHVLGATGSGKSTVALHVITKAMAANRSVVVIEPKGDLIQDVLARVPKRRLDDVVVISPTSSGPNVGLNPLIQPGVPGELIVDQVLSVFKGLFGEAIGPRTQDILTAGLLTLVNQPVSSGARTLVALPLLFTDASFRRRLLKNIRDPLGLAPFWAWWDALSAAEQATVLAAPMNKLRQFLVRPRLRRTIGQARPGFDLRELFTRRRIVLLDLNKGALGQESSNLLGSLALAMVWQATLGRTAVPPERRHPVLLVVDEFQDFIHLPQDFADVLVQARSLGLGVFLSHQHLGQITDRNLKAAVLSNARSRLVFVTGQEDAALLVRSDSRLVAEDVTGLGSFQAYASLLTGNEVQPYASIRTLPPPPKTSDPAELRRRSAQRWGLPPKQIDTDLEQLVGLGGLENPAEADMPTNFGVRNRRATSEERP